MNSKLSSVIKIVDRPFVEHITGKKLNFHESINLDTDWDNAICIDKCLFDDGFSYNKNTKQNFYQSYS